MPTPTVSSLPPGRRGLPLIGETLAFLKNPYAFIDSRRAAHGPVFATSLLGRRTAVICGPDACREWIDPGKIQREGAMPGNVQRLFGGRSLPLLDGSEHLARKTQILAGFTSDALPGYLAELEPIVRSSLERWASQGEVGAVEECKRLAIEGICRNVLGLAPGTTTDALRADYRTVANGFTALPINLPGTAFHRALAALDRILAIFDRLLREHRQAPRGDGLSRMLAATGPDGTRITDAAARIELHHVVVAGYIIFAELAAAILHLGQSPAMLKSLRQELRRELPAGPIRVDALQRLPLLLRVVMECKRLCPILAAVFGKARSTFAFQGHTIPAGWMVLWAIRSTLTDPSVYRDPHSFDPDRFSPERAEHQKHEHGYSPHGPGTYQGHKCPGTDYATVFMQLFLAVLVRDFTWELPPQRTGYDWSRTPPEPEDGLRIRFQHAAV